MPSKSSGTIRESKVGPKKCRPAPPQSQPQMNKVKFETADCSRKPQIRRPAAPVVFLFFLLLISSFNVIPLRSQTRSSLYFLELQAISAWNFNQKSLEFYSYLPHHPMQKNSLGLESLIRLYRQKSDLGYFSFQLRVAYDADHDRSLQFQLYNAFFRMKNKLADLWLGHSKPALGLNYSLDNHALLLPDSTMLGHNFDRDWGAGAHRDFRWGDLALTLTTGSGQKIKLGRNYFLSARVSYGVPSRDNYSLGISAFTGRVLEEMEEPEMNEDQTFWSGAAFDATYLWLNSESRLELNLGRRAGQPWHLLFFRQGLNFLEEGRLKLEAQGGVLKHSERWTWLAGTGLTYRLSADLTVRSLFLYDRQTDNFRLVLQLYFYKNIF